MTSFTTLSAAIGGALIGPFLCAVDRPDRGIFGGLPNPRSGEISCASPLSLRGSSGAADRGIDRPWIASTADGRFAATLGRVMTYMPCGRYLMPFATWSSRIYCTIAATCGSVTWRCGSMSPYGQWCCRTPNLTARKKAPSAWCPGL